MNFFFAKLKQRIHAATSLYVLVAAFILTTVVCFWLYSNADHQTRESLLTQSRLIAQSLNVDAVKSLTGTPADLKRPQYLQLHQQLSPLLNAETSYRYVYLMGRNAKGEVIFLLDADSEDPALPGTVYPEASQEFHDSFDNGEFFVEGPLPDQWGIWVSATIPLIDPATGRVIAVLGMDADASNWRWRVLQKVIWPAGWSCSIIFSLALVVILLRRETTASKLVLTRLLMLLTVGLIVLVAGEVCFFLWYYKRGIDYSGRQKLEDAVDCFAGMIADRYRSVAALGLVMARDPVLQDRLAKNDSVALRERYAQIYQQVNSVMDITRLRILDKERKVLVQLPVPMRLEENGGQVTVNVNDASRRAVCGLELDADGMLAVRSWAMIPGAQGTAGYLELGESAEDMFKQLRKSTGLETVLLLRKSFLTRTNWEMERAGREALGAWERFSDVVVGHSSIPLPKAADDSLVMTTDYLGKLPGTFFIHGRYWQALSYPLNNTEGVNIGTVAFLYDITIVRSSYQRIFWLALTIGALALFMLWTGMFLVLRRTDLQIRRQIEMIRDGEHRYYVLFSDSPDAYLILSEMTITACNQAACRMFHCAADDIVGKRPGDFSLPNQSDAAPAGDDLESRYRQAYLQDQHFEWRCRRPDGSELWCEIATSVILLHGKRMIFSSVRDVTDRKHTQERLLQSEHMAAIGLFAAGIAHNFNNLHAGILGHLQLLQRHESFTEYGARKMSLILDTIGRAINLTENILLLTGETKHECMKQSLAAIIRDNIELIRDDFIADGIIFELQLDEEAVAYCNGGEIRHVILNLLVNARHAMVDSARKVITVQCGVDGDFSWFRISDTGCGISDETRGKMFTPFFSTKGVYAPPGSSFAKIEGTGLGLSSSKSIIDSHHGEILVESSLGVGTSFTIRLHRQQEPL